MSLSTKPITQAEPGPGNGDALAHEVRNDFLVVHRLLREASTHVMTAIKALTDAHDRIKQAFKAFDEKIAPAGNRALRLLNPVNRGIREDRAGSGRFGSPRSRNGVKYGHSGLDLVCEPGQSVYAPFDALVERGGLVYSDDQQWKLVCLSNGATLLKLMYVDPSPGVIGARVREGDQIGTAQDITGKSDYRERGMKPHVHVEVRQHGKLLDPEPLIFGEEA